MGSQGVVAVDEWLGTDNEKLKTDREKAAAHIILTPGTGGGVGIGTTMPGTKLDVVGTVRMTGFQLGTGTTDGHVLTTDASGLGNWQAPAEGLPSGVIVMWSGCTTAIPTGWALCDGRIVDGVTTPDLSDRFIYGIGRGENPGTTGGSTSHTHTARTDTAGAHTHAGGTLEFHRVVRVTDRDYFTGWTLRAWDLSCLFSFTPEAWYGTTSSAGDHTHTVDVDTANHLPPYYRLAFIMKL